MSGKHCCDKWAWRRKILKRIFWVIVIVVSIGVSTFLILRAVFKPTKPNFVLQDATVFSFAVTSPNLLTSSFQVTLCSSNPNNRMGVYYGKLDVYATYGKQQITFRTAIHPTYQGQMDTNIWSPIIYGTAVPIAPFNALSLSQEQANGAVLLTIEIDGTVRWKAGSFIYGRQHLNVRCPAYISFGNQTNGIVVGDNAVKYQLLQSCSVSA
ncbi:hypothetical protein FH972_016685 [Carpinus fangiana]|uniref:Late embryogenesis abundant protein LEA-2 subgroup domain-containing protein n=1 Tax=Carpinus fangiana TaxID=176857 RepID=A0A5N6RKE5_9ROSI|nr:hypothetical protein FH972_016685 [Carpinus fangiana]